MGVSIALEAAVAVDQVHRHQRHVVEAEEATEHRRIDDPCSKADTYEALQMVSLSAASVGITLGIFLIATGGREDEPQAVRPLDVTVGVGPSGGHLVLLGRF